MQTVAIAIISLVDTSQCQIFLPLFPRNFGAPGTLTPGVWAIAERGWHQKPERRPEVKTVLQNLENIANPGGCTHTTSVLPYTVGPDQFMVEQAMGRHRPR